MTYADLLERKRHQVRPVGPEVDPDDISDVLYPFQRDLVAWAVHKGRAALFADTGLGKTLMQLEWARQLGSRTLIVAPLAVTHQTIREGIKLGLDVRYVRSQEDVDAAEGDQNRRPEILITNYEMVHHLDPVTFGAVVLDESSILKSYSGVMKRRLIEMFRETPYRLACTATPAPNDIEELCNHADFLGWMSPAEMRSTFFIADSRGEFMRYRLKGHAKDAFWRWMASWAAAVKRPSDLGYDDGEFALPPLQIEADIVETDWHPDDGRLLMDGRPSAIEHSRIRKATVGDRVARTVEVVEVEPAESWLIWCGLNAEADAMAAALPEAVNVQGSDSTDAKAAALLAFADGELRVLVTKPSIAGFGMNFQRCARMVFVGLGYSYEQYYQAIRRAWRFGQSREVVAHLVLADAEEGVLETVRAKEAQAASVTAGILAGVTEHNRAEIFSGTSKGDTYEPTQPLAVPRWMETA